MCLLCLGEEKWNPVCPSKSTFRCMWPCNSVYPADPRITESTGGWKRELAKQRHTPFLRGSLSANMRRIMIPAWKLSMWLTSGPTPCITIASLIMFSSLLWLQSWKMILGIIIKVSSGCTWQVKACVGVKTRKIKRVGFVFLIHPLASIQKVCSFYCVSNIENTIDLIRCPLYYY